jgi:ABC-2 type transport system ATP-binding protein
MTSTAIVADGLCKSYGQIRALDSLDLCAQEGTVLALLGPNGAGKTTAVRILTTLIKPDGGRALVAGLDVVKQAGEVRTRIGATGQFAAVDEDLTGDENLRMFAQLYHLSDATAKRRSKELLATFDLTPAAARLVKTYSGGMRRLLDLAASLIMSPPIIFLDEPTTGLDPRGRLTVYGVINDLIAAGTTILLTTQYLEEADQLAHQVVVIDRGRVIATGTSDELKARVGGERLDVTLVPGGDLSMAMQTLARHSSGPIRADAEQRHLSVPVKHGPERLAAIVRDLDAAGVSVVDLALRRPSLDDVFLSLTGRSAADPKPAGEVPPSRAGS